MFHSVDKEKLNSLLITGPDCQIAISNIMDVMNHRSMFLGDMFLTRGRLPISSFICFIGGFSMGSWLTLFHQLQLEKDLTDNDFNVMKHSSHETLLLLAVIIISAPKNFDLRDTLRSSWLQLNPSKKLVKHFFVVGLESLEDDLVRRLKQEQTVHGDMILFPDFTDSYHNLTLKITRSLTFLTSTTPFQYVLKCDDDSFAKIDAIVVELQERQRKISLDGLITTHTDKCFYWGFFDGRAKVQKKGKWKEADYTLCDLYLPYALGGGYIINKKCSDFIVRNQDVLKTYRNEDVTMGTWLSAISHEKKHDVRFDTEYESRGCSNKYLVQHKLTQAEMAERFKNLVKTGNLCTNEFRRRPSYEYQWQLPPSQCCKREASII